MFAIKIFIITFVGSVNNKPIKTKKQMKTKLSIAILSLMLIIASCTTNKPTSTNKVVSCEDSVIYNCILTKLDKTSSNQLYIRLERNGYDHTLTPKVDVTSATFAFKLTPNDWYKLTVSENCNIQVLKADISILNVSFNDNKEKVLYKPLGCTSSIQITDK